MPKEQFKREVVRELTGRETEPHEIIYFKLYKSQILVVEQALETAALMLGANKSRGYCLKMICADFLTGANLEKCDPELLLRSIRQSSSSCPASRNTHFWSRQSRKCHDSDSTQAATPATGSRITQAALQPSFAEGRMEMPVLHPEMTPRKI